MQIVPEVQRDMLHFLCTTHLNTQNKPRHNDDTTKFQLLSLFITLASSYHPTNLALSSAMSVFLHALTTMALANLLSLSYPRVSKSCFLKIMLLLGRNISPNIDSFRSPVNQGSLQDVFVIEKRQRLTISKTVFNNYEKVLVEFLQCHDSVC